MSEQKHTWEQELFEKQRERDILEAQEKRKRKIYKEILEYFSKRGLNMTPTEAVFMRREIANVIEANKQLQHGDLNSVFPMWEAMARFFWNYYGINFDEYLRESYKGKNSLKEGRKRVEELFTLIREKYRPEKEELERRDDEQK
jgi:hypothetical protein